MNKEIERLSLHRQIIEGKLTIPSNEATKRSLSQHLARIDAQIERLTLPRERPDPLERVFNLQAQYKRYGKYWTPERRREYRKRIREARVEADDGIKLPKWKPPSEEEFAALKARLVIVLAKYARVPA